MSNFHKIYDVDTSALLDEVLSQPELWNKNPCRLSKYGPHHETDDIFLRCKDETENLQSGDWSNFSELHIPDWYKSADLLPSAKRIIFDLMAHLQGEMLGGVFLYRVQPGKKIHPHIDKGWHPAFYDKFNVCLQSNDKAAFCYEDGDPLIQKAGEVHSFQNNVLHHIVNEGDTDHIIMIVCIRTDRGYRVPWSPEGWTLDASMGRG